METELGMTYNQLWRILGNFLSGMETPERDVPGAFEAALETSLVEWKLAVPAAGDCAPDPWKLP